MTTDTNGTGPDTLSPDEAFAVLGNETRIEILEALGEADGSSPVRDRTRQPERDRDVALRSTETRPIASGDF